MNRRYFGTDGIRGPVGQAPMTPDFCMKLGFAAGKTFGSNMRRPKVLIGKDTRVSGYMLESALEAGLIAAGADVLLAGPLPTPAVAYLTRTLRLDAGIVISASHNPFADNGIKFFGSDGKKLSDTTETQIEALLQDPMGCNPSESLGKAKRLDDATGRYVEFCKSTFPTALDLRGLKIVVDCANGAAYQATPAVLRELGATVHEIAVSPDGFNINANVGAVHPALLQATILEHKADVGIALDGDADRLQMVDAKGRLLNGDELLYIVVMDRARFRLVPGVVGTLMSNYGLETKLKEQGIGFDRAKVGDRYVLEQMLNRGWLYGGESSGHLIFLDCHSTGDGTIAALQVLAAMVAQAKPLAALTQELILYPQVLKNVRMPAGFDWASHPPLLEAQRTAQAQLQGKGRVLIRASGTEPVLRIMVETADAEQAQHLCSYLVQTIS